MQYIYKQLMHDNATNGSNLEVLKTRLSIYYDLLAYFEIEKPVWSTHPEAAYNVKCLCFAVEDLMQFRWEHAMYFIETVLPELWKQRPAGYKANDMYSWFPKEDIECTGEKDEARCNAIYTAIESLYKKHPELYA